MPFEFRRDLHLDIRADYGSVLMVSSTDSALLNSPPDFIAGDKCAIRLYFWERGESGTLHSADPGDDSDILFTGRATTLSVEDDLLFSVNDFTKLDEGVWEGTLDLTPDEFKDHLEASPAGPKVILGEVKIRDDAGDTNRLSLHFDIDARPQVYANLDTPSGLPNPTDFVHALLAPIDRTSAEGAPAGAFASNTLSATAIAAGETVTIGLATYQFVSGAAGSAFQITMNGGVASTLALLETAINEGYPGFGTTIGPGTIINPYVTAEVVGPDLVVTAKTPGSEANSLATTETLDNGSWSSATLAGGIDPAVADYVGQLFRVGDSSPFTWYRWDGTIFEEI